MTVEQWSLLVGLFLPALVSIVNRAEWKSWVKAIVALLASVAVGTVTALLSGQFTGANWATSIGIVFGVSQAAYVTWWKGSDIAKKIESGINGGNKTIDGEVTKSEVVVSK
jgi:hypothetical protein